MRLKLTGVPAAAGQNFSAFSYVFDFKDLKSNPDLIRMFVDVNSEAFKLKYKDADKHT